jgi:hypothetical protein
VVERLDLAGLGGDQLGRAARVLDRLPRFGQLDLLDALVGDEERDALALKLVCHAVHLSIGEDPSWAFRPPAARKRRRTRQVSVVSSRGARGSRTSMGYVIAGIFVLLLVTGFIAFLVLNSTRKGGPVARDAGSPGVGQDESPLGDTTEHAGEASDPERPARPEDRQLRDAGAR